MPNEREKLLQVMSSLEADYKSGKISAEKYRYFRSKYEDKLNSIDAMEATKRIRSMQGKPNTAQKQRSKKPTRNKRKEEQDLVQKYIINPKKGDAKYNKNKQSSMGGGTFKLVALLVLVVAFTAGVSYGIFSCDFDTVSNANAVAIVEDTAFPEITVGMVNNTTTVDKNDTANTDDSDVETTVTTIDTTTDTSDSSQGSDPTPAPTPSPSPEGGGSEGGSDGGGSADGGGSTD